MIGDRGEADVPASLMVLRNLDTGELVLLRDSEVGFFSEWCNGDLFVLSLLFLCSSFMLSQAVTQYQDRMA